MDQQQAGSPCAVWADGKHPALIVCFGGNHEGLAWETRLRALNVNFLHLQDSRYRWYLEGADGSAGVWDTARKIKDYRARVPGLPLITMGQSSGGHAALRFGLMLGADLMLAFAPQTRFLIPRPIYKDQAPLYPPHDLIDIRPELNATKQRAVIIIGRSEVENPPSQYFLDDEAHLEGIDERENVKVIRQNSHTHTVAREMASAGVLDDFLTRHVASVSEFAMPLGRLGNAAARQLRSTIRPWHKRW